MPGDRVVYRNFVRPYREGVPLHDIAERQRTDVADVLKVLATEGVLLRTQSLSILPEEAWQELARKLDAESARCRSEDAMARKYGLSSTALKSLRMTAAILRQGEAKGVQEPRS